MSNATHALTLLSGMLSEPNAMEQIMAETRKQGASEAFIRGLSRFLGMLQDREYDPERVKRTLQQEVVRIREERTKTETPDLERSDTAQGKETGPLKKREGRER